MFYLGTRERRENHSEEIEELLKNKELIPVYLREMGKTNSKFLKKRLREVGVTRGWFAVADDVVVASAKSREDLEDLLEHVMPKRGKESSHIFKIK